MLHNMRVLAVGDHFFIISKMSTVKQAVLNMDISSMSI